MVTEDTVHIGLAIADVTAFSNVGDQIARFQVVVDEINANGGVIGRQIQIHPVEWPLLELTCFSALNDHLTINVLDLDNAEVGASNGLLFSILSDRHKALLSGLEQLADILRERRWRSARRTAVVNRLGRPRSNPCSPSTASTWRRCRCRPSPTSTTRRRPAEQNRLVERWAAEGFTHVVAIGNAPTDATTALIDSRQTDITIITPTIGVRSLTSLDADLSRLSMTGVEVPECTDVAEAGGRPGQGLHEQRCRHHLRLGRNQLQPAELIHSRASS